MKRCALLRVLAAIVPVGAFAQATRYIVVTRVPAAEMLHGSAARNDEWQPRVAADIREFRSINAFAADLTDEEVAQLQKSSNVRWIEPVVERHLLSDTITPGQQTTPFGINMVHAPDVWPVTKGVAIDRKTAINVAVIDTGLDVTNAEFKTAYKGGHNFITGSDNPMDDEGHGTHVAGTIAAADDGSGVVGVAPQVALWSLKVLDHCGSGSNETVMAAVDWVIAKKSASGGNWIINMSLGSDLPSDAEKAECQKAADAGVLIFAAAGNSYDDSTSSFYHVDGLGYPAGYPSVVSVGAVDETSAIASFSQRGADLKLVAPGVKVLSTVVLDAVTTNGGSQFGVSPMSATDSRSNPFCFTAPTAALPFVYCGIGNPADFPASVKGNIALIERGTLTFAQKAKNAKAAGAAAAIIYNNVAAGDTSGNGGLFGGTLGTLTSSTLVPYTVSMSQEDGLALKATANATITFQSGGIQTFALYQGTSMATPHAAGVAALVWAVAPTAPASAIANAMEQTAIDLGTPGFDTTFGNGLVNALNAAKQLNPAAFGYGVQPSTAPVQGRIPGRRGH